MPASWTPESQTQVGSLSNLDWRSIHQFFYGINGIHSHNITYMPTVNLVCYTGRLTKHTKHNLSYSKLVVIVDYLLKIDLKLLHFVNEDESSICAIIVQ